MLKGIAISACTAVLLIGQLANAALGDANQLQDVSASRSAALGLSSSNADLRLGMYYVTRDFQLPVFAVQEELGSLNIAKQNVQIPFEREDGMQVLEIIGQGPKAKVLISFDQANPQQANNFWTTQENLTGFILPNATNFGELFGMDTEDLQISESTTEEELSDELDTASAEIGEASTSQFARRGGGRGKARGKGSYCTRNPRSKGCCYSAVKSYLLNSGLVRTRLAGQAARGAGSALAKLGWKSVGCGARSNPSKHMVCTYTGGKWGHTEVYNGRCWYYGAKCTSKAMSSPSRRCTSCKVRG